MKKIFLALMCVAALAMVSCDNSKDPNKSGTNVKDVDVTKLDATTEKCWAVGTTAKVNDISDAVTNYYWGTEKAIVEEAQDELKEYEEMCKQYGLTLELVVKYSEASPKDKAACKQMDDAAEKEYLESGNCWKINVTAGTVFSQDVYMWGHESAVLIGEMEGKVMIEEMIKQYGLSLEVKTSHEKADFKDPDSCEAQNKGLTGMPELLKK